MNQSVSNIDKHVNRPNKYTRMRWTDEHRKLVNRMYHDGKSIEDMAIVTGREYNAIRSELSRQKLSVSKKAFVENKLRAKAKMELSKSKVHLVTAEEPVQFKLGLVPDNKSPIEEYEEYAALNEAVTEPPLNMAELLPGTLDMGEKIPDLINAVKWHTGVIILVTLLISAYVFFGPN